MTSSFCRSWSSHQRRGTRVQRAADLCDHALAVPAQPDRVEVPAPAGALDPNLLPDRGRQPEPTAQPTQINLTERLRTLRDVVDGESKNRMVPQPVLPEDGRRQLLRCRQTLLHPGGKDPACRPRIAERRGGQRQRRSDAVQLPADEVLFLVPVTCVMNSRRQAGNPADMGATGYEYVRLVALPTVEALVLERGERSQHRPPAAVGEHDAVDLPSNGIGVVQDDRPPEPLPTAGANVRTHFAVGVAPRPHSREGGDGRVAKQPATASSGGQHGAIVVQPRVVGGRYRSHCG